MQTAGHLVPLASELAAGVKLRQHHGEGRQVLILDQVDGNAPACVPDGDRLVRVDGDVDEFVVTRQGLVDGVVDHLVDEVVKATRTGGADVHPGSQPNRLETLQNGDVLCGVRGLGARQVSSPSIKKALQIPQKWAPVSLAETAVGARPCEARSSSSGDKPAELRIFDRGRYCLPFDAELGGDLGCLRKVE